MNEELSLKDKLGRDVFKETREPHIKIRAGREKDPVLRNAVAICPAELYRVSAEGAVELSLDGCLECGSCLIACGAEVLEWSYPPGGGGVQYRFG
jgi:ferredoxin like protein